MHADAANSDEFYRAEQTQMTEAIKSVVRISWELSRGGGRGLFIRIQFGRAHPRTGAEGSLNYWAGDEIFLRGGEAFINNSCGAARQPALSYIDGTRKKRDVGYNFFRTVVWIFV